MGDVIGDINSRRGRIEGMARRKYAIFVGLGLFSWVFGPRKFRRFL